MSNISIDINSIINSINLLIAGANLFIAYKNIKLLKKQNIELMSPNLNINIDIGNGLIKLKIENNGKNLMKNFNIDINNEFLDELKNIDNWGYKALINFQKCNNKSIGSNQTVFLFLCSHFECDKFSSNLIINTKYVFMGEEIKNEYIFDLSQFNGALIETDYLHDISKTLEKLEKKLK